MIFHHDFSRDRCRSYSIVKNQPMESTCKENIRGQDSGSAARYLYIVMFKGLILKLRMAKKRGGRRYMFEYKCRGRKTFGPMQHHIKYSYL